MTSCSDQDSKLFRILFVCLGNICRSPAAEASFRNLCQQQGTSQHFTWDSAGTAAYHIGKAADSRMRAAAEARGIAMGDLRARQVQSADFYKFDLVVAMDYSNLANLQAIQPPDSKAKLVMMLDYDGASETEVPDPYYGAMDGFDQVLDMLDKACRHMHNQYSQGLFIK